MRSSGAAVTGQTKTDVLREALRSRILEQAWTPGQKLPTEREIAQQFSVSRITVRESLHALEMEGLLNRIQGSGTYVADHTPESSKPERPLTLLYPRHKHIQLSGDPYYANLVEGINRALAEHGKGLLTLCQMQTGSTLTGCLPRSEWKRELAGGVLVHPEFVTREDVSFLQTAGIPAVCIGRHEGLGELSFVDVNNCQGLGLAVAHLIQHGHERIALVNGPQTLPYCRDRLAGYRQTLEQYGGAVDPELLVESLPWFPEEAEKGILALLDRGVNFTAVIGCGNRATLGCMRALQGRGLRVPDDVAVIAYDDYPDLLQWVKPAVSAVRQPIAQMGYEAARMVREAASGENRRIVRKILNAELVIRDSCGCPPPAAPAAAAASTDERQGKREASV